MNTQSNVVNYFERHRLIKPPTPAKGAFVVVVIRSTSWEYTTIAPTYMASSTAREAFKAATSDPNTLFAILYDHEGCADVYEVE
jgi:hypothetical protein